MKVIKYRGHVLFPGLAPFTEKSIKMTALAMYLFTSCCGDGMPTSHTHTHSPRHTHTHIAHGTHYTHIPRHTLHTHPTAHIHIPRHTVHGTHTTWHTHQQFQNIKSCRHTCVCMCVCMYVYIYIYKCI